MRFLLIMPSQEIGIPIPLKKWATYVTLFWNFFFIWMDQPVRGAITYKPVPWMTLDCGYAKYPCILASYKWDHGLMIHVFDPSKNNPSYWPYGPEWIDSCQNKEDHKYPLLATVPLSLVYPMFLLQHFHRLYSEELAHVFISFLFFSFLRVGTCYHITLQDNS